MYSDERLELNLVKYEKQTFYVLCIYRTSLGHIMIFHSFMTRTVLKSLLDFLENLYEWQVAVYRTVLITGIC